MHLTLMSEDSWRESVSSAMWRVKLQVDSKCLQPLSSLSSLKFYFVFFKTSSKGIYFITTH